jgi:hypothetical protein
LALPSHSRRSAREGEYLLFLEGREVSCPAGAFIFIPAGMRHGFRVGGVASRKLNLYTPAAMVGPAG